MSNTSEPTVSAPRFFKVDGPDFKGTIDGQAGFWLYTKADEGQREMVNLAPGESTVYIYAEHSSTNRYSVTRES